MTKEEYSQLTIEEKIEISNDDNTPKETIEMLINDEDPNVKLQLLMNSKGAKEMFENLSK